LPPKIFFGREELVGRIVDLADDLIPIALIGVGGIGKTSIALTILHHDRIKQRFGDNRLFIRCDRFPASYAHLLSQLSRAFRAGIQNPEDLASLRPFLSSKVFLVLDNAESILDPQGMDAQKIYAVVEELSRFDNICLCITSRISTVPPDCKRFDVPTLSKDAAGDTFYRIYNSGDKSDLVNPILEQLNFHPLSITLLATVGHQNKWDIGRLTREWERQRGSVLQTEHNNSLAATIELSLTSPIFRKLGPDARALISALAFFPQGIDEDNISQLFPTIPNRTKIFDTSCDLSLTHWSDGFVVMLTPLRDYLSPEDPDSSLLLCMAKELYFTQMSVDVSPDKSDSWETGWIKSEDANVEHLLDVFTTINPNSDSVWVACHHFIRHLHLYKPRPTILVSRIEGLPDDHPSKQQCLSEVLRMFCSIGYLPESRWLLFRMLELYGEQGDDLQVTRVLGHLSHGGRRLEVSGKRQQDLNKC